MISRISRKVQKIRTKGDLKYQSEPGVAGWEAKADKSLRSEDKGGKNEATEVPHLDGVG